MATLKVSPWSSDIELSFYAALASLKINHDKLDDSARKVLGLYEIRPKEEPGKSCRMQIHSSALTTDESIWEAIQDGTIYSCPSLLSSFVAISFADLKKYKFNYHFAFPALHSDPQWKVVGDLAKLSSKETTGLVDQVQTWKYSVDARQHGYFLAKRVRKAPEHEESGEGEEKEKGQQPKTPQTPGLFEEFGYTWAITSFADYERGFFNDAALGDRFVCFADPSTYPTNPGWQLRNLLVLIRERWHLNEVQVLCYRDTHLRRDTPHSIILQLQSSSQASGVQSEKSQAAIDNAAPTKMPKVTGWERNGEGKVATRMVDLAEYMDPTRLADQAVDLNLKLIKWRIAPSVDLDIIKNTKCLLLGAGTLGSYVSRNLLGWGCRHITFVDNANVSFSNPVRQPLFDFKDCLDGGAQKAYRAAEVLSEIYPGVKATGHVMSVPMAGHPVTDEMKSQTDFIMLKKLIEDHDAIFLLMDTRESRWLPTVMGKAAGKIVLNAALGFDTYVVMRHGLKESGPGEEELGCYFCNDVVAPADSLKDATLDQQCTVTRPGIAPIASALLVELLVSILQHPLKAHAPAPNPTVANHNTSHISSTDPSIAGTSSPSPFKHPLGLIPHQLRGFLSTFSNMLIRGQPYDCCSACSPKILELYKKDGWEFVKRALNEKGWVEEVSGLKEVQRKADEAANDVDWDTEQEDDGDGEGELL
ncbi:autophagy-related protein 7 [Saccharata proteae CBS 121410]|uniref:Ubiquitin-like modifier-activating enzyme ATG7 n=1 Tax=Saccharata proteae CBS 121410 TaxID=1314787 RepID=A0A9P4HV11_9PEZI|nr:autophagy-related protein 7 [Saccharata proteae CBS 121410]